MKALPREAIRLMTPRFGAEVPNVSTTLFDRDLLGHYRRRAPLGLARSSTEWRRYPGRDRTPRWSDAGWRANRRHADAEETRRPRVGLASESPDESRHPEAPLQ